MPTCFPESLQQAPVNKARPSSVSLQMADTQSTLSSTSTAEVKVVHPEDSTLHLKIQRGFNFQRQTAGAMAGGKVL